MSAPRTPRSRSDGQLPLVGQTPPTRWTRRRFLRSAGAGLAATFAGSGALALMACEKKAPAVRESRSVHLLQWSSFVKEADEEIRRQAAEFQSQTGIKITIETINANDLNARATAAVESGHGPDIIQLQYNQTQLYASGCLEVDALSEELAPAHGGWYDASVLAAKVDRSFLAIPYAIVGATTVYREDLFDRLGITRFPETYAEYLETGKKLKQAGMPVGQTLGHTFGDAQGWCYPLMWAFGAQEVAEDGRTVVINSPQMIEAVTFMREFWKAACDDGGLAWDDTSNNRAFLAGTIGATNNGASIYFVARQNPDQYPGLADKLQHSLLPKGPSGKRFNGVQCLQHSIMRYSPNQDAAADFLRFLMAPENYEKWFVISSGYTMGAGQRWREHKLWARDPRIAVFRDLPATARMTGYAGPYNQKSSEAQAKYIVVDAFAKAVQGESPESAVAWAEKELKNVYERA